MLMSEFCGTMQSTQHDHHLYTVCTSDNIGLTEEKIVEVWLIGDVNKYVTYEVHNYVTQAL